MNDETNERPADEPAEAAEPSKTVVVVGPDGRPIGTVELGSDSDRNEAEEDDPSRLIEQPARSCGSAA
jgi:hypothetical protein